MSPLWGGRNLMVYYTTNFRYSSIVKPSSLASRMSAAPVRALLISIDRFSIMSAFFFTMLAASDFE
jgi:hypothetical protein|tara:strand:- start:378 stop:575 length:198 start_codon:yes stop_codon:yes gene_type:complete